MLEAMAELGRFLACFGRYGRHDAAAHLLGWRFELAHFRQEFDHLSHDSVPFFDVSHFTPFELDRYLDFVFVLQEADRLLDLEFNIMVTSLWSQANFLRLGVVRLVLVLLLALLVLVLSIVHDAAHRRLSARGHFYKIQARFPGDGHGFISRQNA